MDKIKNINVKQPINPKLKKNILARYDEVRQILSTLANTLGIIFLIPLPWIGGLLWLTLIQNPRHIMFALIGVSIGSIVARILVTDHPLKLGGDQKANALMVAIAVAWITEKTGIPIFEQVAMAIVAAASVAMFATALEHALKGTCLPPLVWGYCFGASMLFILFPNWAEVAHNALDPWFMPRDMADWGIAFLRSLGSILFTPTAFAGIVISVVILIWSRVMFISGAVAWVSGIITAIIFQNLNIEYLGAIGDWLSASYNFFIAGMALGSVFFLPSWASLFTAGVSGCVAAFFTLVILAIFPGSPVALLPLSAVLTIWIGIGAITRNGGKRSILWQNKYLTLPPEKAWWNASYWYQRFGREEPLLAIPALGPVLVAQSFDGELSHMGSWRYALDLQRPEPNSNTKAADLSIWSAPIVSPSGGIVERVKNNIHDNPLGVSNFAENWGNHVIIRLDDGGWALLAHLKQGTSTMISGSRVEAGDYVGQAGNSGRSPASHLHLQVQDAPSLGAVTTPFRLANYQSADSEGAELLHWNAAGIPATGTIIKASLPNPKVHNVLAMLAPGSAVWQVEVIGSVPSEFHQKKYNTTRVNVSLNDMGQHIFSVNNEGDLITHLAQDAWRVIEPQRLKSPLLKLLGMALPTVPYAATVGMTWDDIIPLIPTGTMSWLKYSFSPYIRHPFPHVQCKCIAEPNSNNEMLEIETVLKTHSDKMPFKITCQLQQLRGPVRIQADFEEGSIVYSQLSFEPGMLVGKKL